jgi:hypothetical protein
MRLLQPLFALLRRASSPASVSDAAGEDTQRASAPHPDRASDPASPFGIPEIGETDEHWPEFPGVPTLIRPRRTISVHRRAASQAKMGRGTHVRNRHNKNPTAEVWWSESRSACRATRYPSVFSFIAIASILALSACAGAKVAGNDIGGVIPLVGTTKEHALEMARDHCSLYGRSARILAIRAEEGGKAVFECV